MAFRLANATGNFNTAATWLQGTNTPTLHASNNIALSTSPSLSATFTAPNTSNAASGLLVYLVEKGTATTITATLQESTVDTAHTQTITLANVEAGTWIYFKPAAPYTFTTTSSNAYRWKLTVNSGTTTTVAQATTANFAYISLDNRQVVPVSGDNVFIAAANGTTAVTVTMDGTQTIGTNVNGGVRSLVNAMYVSTGATLAMDTAASSTLNHRGAIFVAAGGTLTAGTVGSPLNKAYTAQFIANTANQGLMWNAGANIHLQGAPKSSTTLFKANYVSGVGTAASPLVVNAPVDWDVGDELRISPGTDGGTNYNETETKFIITKNSATSYVLSDTSGGSENALSFTKNSDTIVGNFQRNVIVRGLNTSILTGLSYAAPANVGEVDIDWVRFENVSNSTFLGAIPLASVNVLNNTSFDYCVGVHGAAGIFYVNGITTPTTYRGIMADNLATTVGLGAAIANITVNGSRNVTLEDCVSFSSNTYGVAVAAAFQCLVKDTATFACNNAGAASAGLIIQDAGKNQFTNVRTSANRVSGLIYNSGSANVFTECRFGLGATNPADITMGTGFSQALFEDSIFESAVLIANYLNMTAGSEIRFNRYQDTDNQHRWYDVYGHGISEPTIIRSPGLAVKLVPENAGTGFTWQFKVPVTQNTIAGFRGYFLKNADLGSDDVEIAMYLPGNPLGNANPDASTMLDDTTGAAFTDEDEQSVAMAVEYDGDIPGAAVVTVNVKSTTPGAALYCDDFFNAGDRTTTYDAITGLNVWSDGKPLEVISPSVSSADDIAAAVWNFPQVRANAADSMGLLELGTASEVREALSNTDATQAKVDQM